MVSLYTETARFKWEGLGHRNELCFLRDTLAYRVQGGAGVGLQGPEGSRGRGRCPTGLTETFDGSSDDLNGS